MLTDSSTLGLFKVREIHESCRWESISDLIVGDVYVSGHSHVEKLEYKSLTGEVELVCIHGIECTSAITV